jgi:hypothetical protein
MSWASKQVPRRPTRRALVATGVLFSLWLASGGWWCDLGNGRSWDVRIEGGRFGFRCGEPPGIGDKWFCNDGFDCGMNWDGRYSLVIADWPWVFWWWRPFSLTFTVPLSVVVVPASGAIVLWSSLRRRPPGDGRCGKCGYDLTGNVSGRCSECGQGVGGAKP